MDLRRVRAWDWLTGLAGAVLLVSLFLPWYGAAGVTATGWESFTVVDVIIAIAALLGIGLPLVAAAQRTSAVPQAWTAFVIVFALVALVVAVVRLLNLPGDGLDREAGVWIACVSALALFYLDARAMGDDSFPAALRPNFETKIIPAPAPDGTRHDLKQ